MNAERLTGLGLAHAHDHHRQPAQVYARGGVQHVVQITQALDAGDGDDVDAVIAQARAERGRVGVRSHAAVALGVFHLCAARPQGIAQQRASAFTAKDHDALAGNITQLWQSQQ